MKFRPSLQNYTRERAKHVARFHKPQTLNSSENSRRMPTRLIFWPSNMMS